MDLKSFRERMDARQDEMFRQSLPILKVGYIVLWVAGGLGVGVWTCAVGYLVGRCLWVVAATGKPLVLNDTQMTWLGTAGFIGFWAGSIVVVLASFWLGVRLFKKAWACRVQRLEKNESSGAGE